MKEIDLLTSTSVVHLRIIPGKEQSIVPGYGSLMFEGDDCRRESE